MNDGVDKVRDFFLTRGIEKEILSYSETTHDSFHAAKALDVEVGQIAKSILFQSDKGPLLVIISGDMRVDMKKVRKSLGAKKLRFAREEEVVKETGFGVGAVSPVALPERVKILIDGSLKRFPVIYPAAGGTNSMFATNYDELVEVSGATEVSVGKGEGE